jgi:N-acetyltransferase
MMVPPMQPVLTDGRVLLRPLAEADRAALFAVASDPLIWAVHPAHDRWQRDVFDAFFDEGLRSDGALAVIDCESGAIIGSSRYDNRPFAVLDGEVEIGWTFIARHFWGGSHNRSMKRMMLAYAFERGFEAAIFLVGETNIRSRRAMEKIGGVLTDRLHHAEMAGREVVHVIYRISRDDFARGPLSPSD